MNKFENRFRAVLGEALDVDLEASAMAETLDGDTDPDAFGANTEPSPEQSEHAQINAKIAQAQSEQAAAMKGQIEGWVSQFADFLELLNGTGPGSIQTVLADSESDTILDRMKQSEQRKIARVATELAALTESFKGYLAQSGNSSFRHV